MNIVVNSTGTRTSKEIGIIFFCVCFGNCYIHQEAYISMSVFCLCVLHHDTFPQFPVASYVKEAKCFDDIFYNNICRYSFSFFA